MSRTFRVEIVTPDETALATEATALQAPAYEGYLGVLGGHAPLLCVLNAGVLTVRPEAAPSRALFFAIKGGFMEVQPDRVVILADAVERAEEIAKQPGGPGSPADAASAAAAATVAEAEAAAASAPTAELRTKAREEAAEARAEATRWAKARRDAAERWRESAAAA